jgi:predicted double-glycine peptidase
MLTTVILAFPGPARSASIEVGGGTRVTIPLQSLKDLRDQNLVKQTYDYSCGAAALATLLTYGLGDTVTEPEILRSVLTLLSKDEEAVRKKQGLSLLDLQQVAHTRGHKAQGFRLAPAYLSQLPRPVIVFIRPRGYEHFAVLKGIRGDRVYLADPSLGNIRMAGAKFLAMWLDDKGQGIIFVVERHDGTWMENSPLKPPMQGLPQPEILTARQMLEVGNRYVRFPPLFR